MRQGDNNIMVILSSPSGAGKTTITKKIQQKYQSFKISVSHTTRMPRTNEVDGVDYNFISKDEFKRLVDANEFYEHAKIHTLLEYIFSEQKNIKYEINGS